MSDLDHLGFGHVRGNHTDHGKIHDPANFVLDPRGVGGSCPAGNTGDCGLHPDSPATPGRVTPDISFFRSMNMRASQTINTKAKGAINVPLFTFDASRTNGGVVPNPIIRVRQGQIVHTNVRTGLPHTIHHHGIEPDTHNDGVGHYSFDVGVSYTYQWLASQAGTYFYHCHVNTVLHAEMGMYGALIIDPPTGPGTAFVNGPAYDVEAIWAVDEFDTSWHCLPWNAALCGGDARLNDFNPDIFIINGKGDADTETHPSVAVTAKVGQRILIRYIQAGYVPHRVSFEGVDAGLGPVKTIAEDGRPLPTAETMPTSGGIAYPPIITSAERRDFYIVPTKAGSYRVRIEFLHWIRGTVLGTIETRIKVT